MRLMGKKLCLGRLWQWLDRLPLLVSSALTVTNVRSSTSLSAALCWSLSLFRVTPVPCLVLLHLCMLCLCLQNSDSGVCSLLFAMPAIPWAVCLPFAKTVVQPLCNAPTAMIPAMYIQLINWNVRGLNNLAGRRAIQKFIADHNCNLVCLQETKLADLSPALVTEIPGSEFSANVIFKPVLASEGASWWHALMILLLFRTT